MVLGTLVIGGLTYQSYSEYKYVRELAHSKASHYIAEYCKNDHIVERTGAAEDCDKRRRIQAQDPTLYALYDILWDWNICGSGQCSSVVPIIAQRLVQLVIALAVLFVCAVYMCGTQLRGWGAKAETELYANFGNYESNKKTK